MRRLLALALHAIAVYVMAWGWLSLAGLHPDVDKWMKTQKGGYFQFLTNQGLLIAWSCMVTSLFADVFPSVAIFRHLKKALLMISMPLEFVISTIYWTLVSFLPHLIMRPLEDPGASVAAKVLRLPLATDLALHAFPLISLLIDFFVFEPKFARRAIQVAPLAVIIFTVWYGSFVEYCATFNGSFPYPFLTHSPLVVRLLIYTTSATIALGCFNVLNSLHA